MPKYPKKIGAVLWLHFVLLINNDTKQGELTTTVSKLNELSEISKYLIKPTLNKLVTYSFIKLTQMNSKQFQIKLNHYGESITPTGHRTKSQLS